MLSADACLFIFHRYSVSLVTVAVSRCNATTSNYILPYATIISQFQLNSLDCALALSLAVILFDQTSETVFFLSFHEKCKQNRKKDASFNYNLSQLSTQHRLIYLQCAQPITDMTIQYCSCRGEKVNFLNKTNNTYIFFQFWNKSQNCVPFYFHSFHMYMRNICVWNISAKPSETH